MGLVLLLAAAARSRARGHSWETIGRELGVPPEVCREWPKRYAGIWDELCAAARRSALAAAQAEALFVLRRQRR